ncbi:ABC transporter permease [Sporosarcina sp. ACRSL]|uniref:ABC transporter permease n=1 Tax=Sporosarcina sp. ACRSL TaxID=2918215 RepID=UPI001EF4F44A|nr:ABC transporter permease [Sporosarcina sp. ACRSL]MCG7344562.1 ABC transporter permease [Sporosarcina sp. ACRSL]
MQSIRKILFFTIEHLKQLKKKRATLLLLFLFPLVLIGLLVGLAAGLIVPDENAPIRVALVDEDQTTESKLISKLLTETANGQQFIQIIPATKEEAERLMERNEISTSFSLPEKFTDDLYEGESVTIPMIGNPSRPIDSFIAKQLVDSLARYIAAAQANILVINDYAKETPMTRDERMEMMFDQFIDFTLYTLGKDRLLDEELLNNSATSSPLNYFVVSAWFIVLSVWLLSFYIVLHNDESKSMGARMMLFGVTIGQRVAARILVSLLVSSILAGVPFILLIKLLGIEFYTVDFIRFGLFAFLYAFILLCSIALIDVWIQSKKIGLLLQCLFVFVTILVSGALIPTFYFPQEMQIFFSYLFSLIALGWMMDLVLEGRNYANYTSLAIYAFALILALSMSLGWKARWNR